MKKLALLSLIAVGMISTTAIAENIVKDTAEVVGGAAGGAVGAGAGAVKGAVEGIPEGAEKCFDATGMPIACGTVGAAGGAVEGTVEGVKEGAVEGAKIGSGQE